MWGACNTCIRLQPRVRSSCTTVNSWMILFIFFFLFLLIVVVGPFVHVSFQDCVVVGIVLLYFCFVFSFVRFFSFQERKLNFKFERSNTYFCWVIYKVSKREQKCLVKGLLQLVLYIMHLPGKILTVIIVSQSPFPSLI